MQHTLPLITVNGVLGAQISPLDRGFTYGDGVFETCNIQCGSIPLWHLHKERLLNSCKQLLIPIESNIVELRVNQLLQQLEQAQIEHAILKITVTRGEGGRGYRLPENPQPTIVVGAFPAADYPADFFVEGVCVRICTQRLGCNSSLASLKHLNRLEQILARAEWQDTSIAEGIMFDTQNNLVEGIFSNIFLIKGGQLVTPDLSQSGVAGVMRRFILEIIAPQAQLKTHIKILSHTDLFSADEIFLCNSLYGIWPVREIVSNQNLRLKPGKITMQLQHLVNQFMIDAAK